MLFRSVAPPAQLQQAVSLEPIQLAGTILIRDEPCAPGSDAESPSDAEEVTLNVQRFMDDEGQNEAHEDESSTPRVDLESKEAAVGSISPSERTHIVLRRAAEAGLSDNLKLLVQLPQEHASRSHRLQTMQQYLSMEVGDELFHCIFEAIIRPSRGLEPYVVQDSIRQVLVARGEKLVPATEQVLLSFIQLEHDMFK